MDENLIVAIAVLVAAYFLYNYFFAKNLMEGMENATKTTSANGVAGNAQNFAAGIQNIATSINDQLLITKYRTDYENVVLNYDNLISAMMLQTLVTADGNKPMDSLKKIADLNSAKIALNSVIKYIDSQ